MTLPRRTFLAGAGGLAAALALGACSDDDKNAAPKKRDARPNILVIEADDMRADEIAYMQRTKRLLVEQGTSFPACRVNVASCSPSRAGFVTGLYSDRHHVENESQGLKDYNPTLGPWLSAAGYRTAVIGKFFTNLHARKRRPGWTTWRGLVDDSQRSHGYGVNMGDHIVHPKEHQDIWIRAETTGFITADDSRPWFAWVCPTDPHWPYDPLPQTKDEFSKVEWPVDPDPSLEGKPSWVRQRPALTPAQVARTQYMEQQRLRELQGVDLLIEAAVGALERSGQIDNTYIVFTSDNANAVGERRVPYATAKNQPYDECLRVPLVVRGKGFDTGASILVACNHEDIAAMIVKLAKAKPTVKLDGTPLDTLGPDKTRAILHYRHGIGDPDVKVPNGPAGDGITTVTHKLFRYRVDNPDDRYELYDLETDPGEVTNLAYDPAFRSERDEMERRLDALLNRPR
jgi:arylsulfatase A-like enzyme